MKFGKMYGRDNGGKKMSESWEVSVHPDGVSTCEGGTLIEGSFVAVFEHTLKIFAVIVGAGHGAVDVSADDDQFVAFCIIVADVELPFDGLLGLPLGTVPRVDDCCFHKETSKTFLQIVEE